MTPRLITPLFLALFLGGISCQKEPDVTLESRTDLLTSGTWRLTGHTFDPPLDLDNDGEADDTDFFPYYEDCEKDDFYQFNADGSGVLDEGPTKCDADDPQTYPFTWSWRENETVLYAQGQEIHVTELTKTTLKGTVTENFSGTETVTMTLTFSR